MAPERRDALTHEREQAAGLSSALVAGAALFTITVILVLRFGTSRTAGTKQGRMTERRDADDSPSNGVQPEAI